MQLSFFHQDFEEASTASKNFGNRVRIMASEISEKYYGLVALAARQVFVGTEISIGKDAAGRYNTSDIMSFTKGEQHDLCFETRAEIDKHMQRLQLRVRFLACNSPEGMLILHCRLY